MDKLDIQILTQLLNNCRTPDRKIGQEVGISGGAVKSRISKMVDKKVIENFALKIEPPIFGFNVLYFVVSGQDLEYIIKQVKLLGEPFFVVPCVGGITVCSIVIKDDPEKKIELAKNLMKDVRVLSIFEAKNLDFKYEMTKTDLEIIEVLLDDPRIRIDQIAKSTGLSTKTITRCLNKIENNDAMQFTLVYDPKKLGGYIPFAILVWIERDVKRTLVKLQEEFGDLFLQKPFIAMNQIVLFFYGDDIFKLDEITQNVRKISGITSADLFIPKKIALPEQWIKNTIKSAKKSKRLHLTYQ
ncbi:MAG TPA: AsnC family transcriptional regulator [Nitrosopumilaceae archaeon]|nr:AsnC family transcriptional regulator [Nitrosopumilaceae archaeon]